MSTEERFRTEAETHEAFEVAIVAVMDYFKSLLADERAKVARLEARIADLTRPAEDAP